MSEKTNDNKDANFGFYYLHEINTPVPALESGFKYLVYLEGEKPKVIYVPETDGPAYCPHNITTRPQWDADDDIVEVKKKHENVLVARFKKIHDEVGFTIWENTNEF